MYLQSMGRLKDSHNNTYQVQKKLRRKQHIIRQNKVIEEICYSCRNIFVLKTCICIKSRNACHRHVTIAFLQPAIADCSQFRSYLGSVPRPDCSKAAWLKTAERAWKKVSIIIRIWCQMAADAVPQYFVQWGAVGAQNLQHCYNNITMDKCRSRASTQMTDARSCSRYIVPAE